MSASGRGRLRSSGAPRATSMVDSTPASFVAGGVHHRVRRTERSRAVVVAQQSVQRSEVEARSWSCEREEEVEGDESPSVDVAGID